MEIEMKEDRNGGPPRKRLLTDPNPKERFVNAFLESTVSSDSSSDRFEKKTRELPNLSDCHSCAVRINYTNPRERLQPLESMWRVVLLCKKCSKRVKSSELCPYCFTAVADETDCFNCSDCQHSIHKDCVAKYGSGLGFSVCVDCWVPDAVANSISARKRKSWKKNKESCERPATLPESRVSVQETNESDFLGEEVEEKFAAAATDGENAKGVLNVVASTKVAGSCESKGVDDAEFAFMLHRAINSSPRISRYSCLTSSLTGDNAPMKCYSRRRANKKASLMNSRNLDAPLICYSRRHQKGSMRNSVSLGAQLMCYSRKRSCSIKACPHARDCECSADLKAFSCGSNAENRENNGGRFNLKPFHHLLKHQRIGKGPPRPSAKDSDYGSCIDSANLNTENMSDTSDIGNGNKCHQSCENLDSNANRFLLKYKRSVRPKPEFSCKLS